MYIFIVWVAPSQNQQGLYLHKLSYFGYVQNSRTDCQVDIPCTHWFDPIPPSAFLLTQQNTKLGKKQPSNYHSLEGNSDVFMFLLKPGMGTGVKRHLRCKLAN